MDPEIFQLVPEYTKTLSPSLSGKWHNDETLIRTEGRNEWFWETIDEETRFLVASHLNQRGHRFDGYP
jgi:transposase-like protein